MNENYLLVEFFFPLDDFKFCDCIDDNIALRIQERQLKGKKKEDNEFDQSC